MNIRTLTILAAVAAALMSQPAFAAPVDLDSQQTPVRLPVAGRPDVILTMLSNGVSGTADAFPGGVFASFYYDQGKYVFSVSTLGQLTTNKTYGLQYLIDVDGWFGAGQDWRLGQVDAGLGISGTPTVEFTTSIQGVLPDTNDPDQKWDDAPGNQPGNREWSDFTGGFQGTLTATGETALADTLFPGSCTRILVTWVADYTSGTVTTLNNTHQLSQIPEPGTFGVLGVGMLGWFLVRRRRQAKRAETSGVDAR